MANQQKEALSFEAALARLDEILGSLERDSVPLDELMKLYEEGVGLLRSCNEQLDGAEQKVKLLKRARALPPDRARAPKARARRCCDG